MGDRQYVPILGRFLSCNPIAGGNSTDYGYPSDPVNASDLSGDSGSDTPQGGYPNTYFDDLAICGTPHVSLPCPPGLTESAVFDMVKHDFGRVFPPGLMAGMPSGTQLSHVGQIIPTKLKIFGIATPLSGHVQVTKIVRNGFDVKSLDGAITGRVKFRIVKGIGNSMNLTVTGSYKSAPYGTPGGLYDLGSPLLWTNFSGNIGHAFGRYSRGI